MRWPFRRARADRDFADEVQSHIELEMERLVAEGLTQEAARAAARRAFGNVGATQERFHESQRAPWLEQLAADIRYSAQRLRRRPGFSGVVIAVLALGIGATTAMFSAVDAAMLRPLPFADPAKLVKLTKVTIPFDPGAAQRTPRPPHSALDIVDLGQLRQVFPHVAAYATGGLNLSDADRPVRVKVGVVTVEFFATLGVQPARGRVFAPAEGDPDGPKVAVLSHALWLRQFGGAASNGGVDGAFGNVDLNGKRYQVVGVMPEGFRFPSDCDLWIPMSIPTTFATVEPFRGYLPSTIIARVAPSLTVAQASQQLLARWERAIPSTPDVPEYARDVMVDVRTRGAALALQHELVGNKSTALLVLLGVTALLLLIACANVTNLLLADAAVRRREIAVREVLGATRGRIIRQLLTESVMLALTGALLGLLLAPLALKVIVVLLPSSLAGLQPASVDLRVLTFATLLALVTGIGFGLWPALRTAQVNLSETIKASSGHGATSASGRTTRRALLVAEIALSLVLLVGAGLMLRSFERLMSEDPGLQADQVATLEIAFPRGLERSVRLQRIEGILERLRGTPGISAAGAVNDLPLRGGGGISVMIRDPIPPKATDFDGGRQLYATAGYFDAMKISLLRGRVFTAGDDSLAPEVAVISKAMAERFWPGQDPVGRTFRMGPDGGVLVIGVVSDVRELNLETKPAAQFYYHVAASPPTAFAIVARSTMPRAALLARMASVVREVDPSQAIYNLRMMDEVVGASVAPRRTNTILMAAFGALALLLAALGVYAVVSYGVTQRTREFGIRSALGATGGDLVALAMREIGWITAAGVAIGLGGAWALSRVLSALLYQIETHDPLTFTVVPLVLVLPALAAAYVPARRALKVNAVEAIRAD